MSNKLSRGLTPLQLIRAARRRILFRFNKIGFYRVDVLALQRVHVANLPTQVIPAHEVHFGDLNNPYLQEADFEHLRNNPESWCVVVRSGGSTIASNWYLRGRIHIPEVSRTIEHPPGAHYSCRTYVEPSFRGRRLKSHMDTCYVEAVRDCTYLTGAIYHWNTSSIRAVVNAGWRRTGTLWSCRILGVTFGNTVELPSAEPVSR